MVPTTTPYFSAHRPLKLSLLTQRRMGGGTENLIGQGLRTTACLLHGRRKLGWAGTQDYSLPATWAQGNAQSRWLATACLLCRYMTHRVITHRLTTLVHRPMTHHMQAHDPSRTGPQLITHKPTTPRAQTHDSSRTGLLPLVHRPTTLHTQAHEPSRTDPRLTTHRPTTTHAQAHKTSRRDP